MKLLVSAFLVTFWSLACFAQDNYKLELKKQLRNYKNIYESSLINEDEFLFLVKGKVSLLEMKRLVGKDKGESLNEDLSHYIALLEEGTLDVDEFCYLVELSLDLQN